MLGRVSREELYEYYRRIRLTIIPSKSEVFNTVALEASNNGCSLLLSPLNSFREMFGEDRAIFFDEFNGESIYKAIRQYYFDVETLEYFSKRAFQHVKKYYNFNKNCIKIISLYKNIIKIYRREVNIELREQKIILWLTS